MCARCTLDAAQPFCADANAWTVSVNPRNSVHRSLGLYVVNKTDQHIRCLMIRKNVKRQLFGCAWPKDVRRANRTHSTTHRWELCCDVRCRSLSSANCASRAAILAEMWMGGC